MQSQGTASGSCDAVVNRRRRLVEMQGFVGLSDDVLQRVEPWLRFSPAVCAAWAAVATAAASVPALLGLAAIAALGAVLPTHPFDVAYNHGIRRVSGGPAIPRYGPPRRFACAVATAWLMATAAAFAAGARVTGTVLGATFTCVALVPVVSGFCVPSFLFGWGRRGRGQPRQARHVAGTR